MSRSCLALLAAALLAPPLAAQVADADDAVRGAALTYLMTELFPADPNPERAHCVGVVPIELQRLADDSVADPSPGLLEVLRRTVPHARPLSQCELPGPAVVTQVAAALAHRPIAYYVGAVRRRGGRATTTIAYRLHGLDGGGWTCELRRFNRRWRVRDCLPLRIS